MGEPEKHLKVFMLPWLAHGHIAPFLKLAKKLTKRNILIYLCSTPVNIEFSITKKLVQPYSESIKLVELHLPTLPNLPPHYHTTNGLPPHLMGTLEQAFKMSKDELSNILSDVKPDVFIHDFSIMWAYEVALSAGIPSIVFTTFGAASFSCILHMVSHPGQEFPFPSMYLHEYEKARLGMATANKTDDSDHEVNPNANKTSDSIEVSPNNDNKATGSSEVNPTRLCNFRLIRSSREIEGKYIDYLSGILNEKVIPLGHLVDQDQDQPINGDDDCSGLVQWLNNKEKRSCIFVSFGSEYFLKNEDIEEIAYGLEMSNINFIWVVRISKEEEGVKVEDILPLRFLEKVGERGRIIEGWAPQSLILRHESVGGFMSHCGWSSALESMTLGVPIIALPMQLDQPFNARLVVEIGVGLEIPREERSGKVRREDVSKVVRKVMVDEEGDGLRKRAKEVSEELMSKEEEEIDELMKQLALINQQEKGSQLDGKVK